MSKKKGLLAFDLGTSGVKCSVYDVQGCLLDARYGEYDTYYPAPDWREQRPGDWIDRIVTACAAMKETLSEVQIMGIGVSGHSLGALPVDTTGKLLVERVPIWSDARAKEQAKRLFEKTDYRAWYEMTGNGFPPELYSIFKIMWYQDHMPEIYEQTAKFIGSKDYVNLYLTGVAATDVSYASGCGIFNLATGEYCEEYARLAGVDIDKFPTVLASSDVVGYVTDKAAVALGIEPGIPVVAGGVDNACMSLGAGCIEQGDSYASLGSSAWITVSTKEPLVDYDNKVYTFAHCVKGQYIPSIGIFASGSALAWAADNLFPDMTGGSRFDDMGALAAQSPAGANGVMFNPCLAGGSSADKSPNIRGNLFHLSLDNTRADVARAVFEGVAMHLYCAGLHLIGSGQLGDRLLLVGGGAKGEFARQTYADVFGKTVAVSRVKQDAASLGAAALTAVGCGLWSSFEPLKHIHRDVTLCEPSMQNHALYERRLPIYQQLCDACSDLGDAVARAREDQ